MFKSARMETENKKKPEGGRTELSAKELSAADSAAADGGGERDCVKSKKTEIEDKPEGEKTELPVAKLAGVVGAGEWDDVPKTDEHDYDPDTIDNA